ncbi:MAG: hypothetical protein O3A51_04955 [Verrucomicrobia bacterium]|nr:hypothetical protein [Verrucomicrobiota bacterium]
MPQVKATGPLMSMLLGYLAGELGVKIPGATVRALQKKPMATIDVEVALFGLGRGCRATWRLWNACATPSARWRILRWSLMPQTAAVRGAGQLEPERSIAAYHRARLLAVAKRCLHAQTACPSPTRPRPDPLA